MTILFVILLAAVEGAASGLLLSGAGHLQLFEKLFGVSELPFNFLYFAVVLHMGNLLAVLATYRKEAAALGRELLRMLHILKTPPQDKKHPPLARRELLLYAVGLLPMLLSLLLLSAVRLVYSLDNRLLLVAVGLALTGLMLFLSERFYRGSKDEKTMTPLDALLIGLAQLPTVFPGLSRAGLTTSVGVMCGLKRGCAVQFSQLLSVPVLLAALVTEAIAAGGSPLQMPSIWLCLIGVAVSALVHYAALKLLARIAQYGRFDNLSYWCWGVGILSAVLVLIA